MKHIGLAPITLVFLVLTTVLLPYSGWFTERESARSPSNQMTHVPARGHELSVQAAGRYRAAQATHWRALLVHH